MLKKKNKVGGIIPNFKTIKSYSNQGTDEGQTHRSINGTK